MPAKRIILCDKSAAGDYRYVLWADVPSGNQIAYRDPLKHSAYENASTAELQALRDGTVAEQVGSYPYRADTLTTIQTRLETEWTAFQNAVTAETPWAEYGRYWSNAPAWNASPGVPWYVPDQSADLPTFLALTGVSAYAANRFHFVLFNNAASATSQALVVKVRLVVLLPGQATVTGVAPSVWTLRRRESPTTAPSGGIVTVSPMDSAFVVPATITLHSSPTTAPAGGTLVPFNECVPQADEQKLSTLDAPSVSALEPWGGLTLYRAGDIPGTRPLIVRANQVLELQQSATAGTGNCRVLCVFTVGG